MATNLKLVHTKDRYPDTVKDSVRPFRIWESQEKVNVPHRCYKTLRRALDSALLLVRWSKVGVTLEVYDIRTAKWHGTYARRVDSITFTKD